MIFCNISFYFQVAKIDIGYAKTAKKVDVKRLKNTMWNLLAVPEPEVETVSCIKFLA